MRHLEGFPILRKFPSSAFREVVMEAINGALEMLQRPSQRVHEHDGKNMKGICHAGSEAS